MNEQEEAAQPDAPYCFLGLETCQEILTSYNYRFRPRTYADEEVPGALLIAFSPLDEKIAIHRLEQLQVLTQAVQRESFARIQADTEENTNKPRAGIEGRLALGEWLTYRALTGLRRREPLGAQQSYLAAHDLVLSAYHARTGHAPEAAERWDVVYRAIIAATHIHLLARSNGRGLLYTFGYTAPGAGSAIEQLVALDVCLADIRYSPNSRAKQWRQSFLQRWMGEHYLHVRELGNVNYNRPGDDIQLLQPESGVNLVAEKLLCGQHLALMCACREGAACHRLEAARRVREQLGDVFLIHL